MNYRRQPVNGDDAREVREQCARFRIALDGSQFFVLATDQKSTADQLHALLALAIIHGAKENQFALVNGVLMDRNGGRHGTLAAVAIAKSCLPADVLIGFLAGISRTNATEYASHIAAGSDFFALGDDAALIAEGVECLRIGQLHLNDTLSN